MALWWSKDPSLKTLLQTVCWSGRRRNGSLTVTVIKVGFGYKRFLIWPFCVLPRLGRSSRSINKGYYKVQVLYHLHNYYTKKTDGMWQAEIDQSKMSTNDYKETQVSKTKERSSFFGCAMTISHQSICVLHAVTNKIKHKLTMCSDPHVLTKK